MTAPTFGKVVPPEFNGDVYKPAENYDRALIVKVKARKEGIVTANSPEGGPGVVCDLVELDTNKILRDVLWMGGAVVDTLTPFVGGEIVVIKFEPKKSNTGRTYPSPINSEADFPRATAFYSQHGDPFAPQFANVTPAVPAAQPAAPAAQPAAPIAPVVELKPIPAAAYQAMLAANLDVTGFTPVA